MLKGKGGSKIIITVKQKGKKEQDLFIEPGFTDYRQLYNRWVAQRAEMVKELSQGQGMGPWVHPIRVAVSGRGEGIGLFEMLQLLGRDRTVSRLRRAAGTLS